MIRGANVSQPTNVAGERLADPTFTAQQKFLDARSLDEALQWLTRIERVEVAGSPQLLNQLAQLPDAPRQAVLI